LGERNFDVANRFLSAVNNDVRKLAEMPGMGAIREFDNPTLTDIRSWPVSGFRNYLIFYRVRRDTLEFMRLIHGAQDIEAALLSP
jgi:toxin ParE1/3/4